MIANMADTRELQLLLTINDKMSTALNRIGNNTGKLQQQTSRLDGAVRGLVGAYIGVQGLRMGIDSTIGAAVRWEDAFAGVRKTVDATEEQFQQLNEGIREMARRIPVSATELAHIGEIAGQLGVKAENIESFTETVAKLGVTTNLTTEEAASNLARIANIMQVPLDQVGNMGSAIVDLGNNFATTEREINDFALRIAGAGRIAGLTTADVFAIGAAMSSVGVQAEAGGTAVQKVLIGMNTSVVTADENLQVFAETAGLSSAEFQKAWRDDAGSAFTLFVEGLGKQGDSAITTLEALGMTDQRLIRSFLSLSNAGDLLEEAISRSTDAFAENNALNAEAEKRFATTASQIQLFKNNVNELGIALGTLLLPSINSGIELLIDWTDAWINAGDNIRDTFSSVKEFGNTLKYMTGWDKSFQDRINEISQAYKNKGVSTGYTYGPQLPNQSIPGLTARANGGPVSSGSPYLVGERGPELFVPGGNGTIVPNGAGGNSYHFTFMGDVTDQNTLIQRIKQALDRESTLAITAGV